MATLREAENTATVLRYLAAIEGGATGAALAGFLAEGVVYEELPNRLSPSGSRRDRAGMLAGAERGQQILRSQKFQVRSSVAEGDRVALEVIWSAALVDGTSLRAHVAMFLELRDGKIVRQRNYDCYEP